ncbi:MAG: Tn3 family transposase [Oscillatoriales cyanobacterium C42_A2020_001]|nr:Tn3 family transposase [Leptolyngbyaceae cyanobacterium C42_A2020_001]
MGAFADQQRTLQDRQQKLHLRDKGQSQSYPRLQAIIKRPIRWRLIREQYDMMVKFAIAIKIV